LLRRASRATVAGGESVELRDGWQVAACPDGERVEAGSIAALEWSPAQVPGTVAGPFGWDVDAASVDARDWWYRCAFEAAAAGAQEQVVLVFEGLATLAEVYLNGRLVLESESMFEVSRVDAGSLLEPLNELAICFRALAPRVAEPRRPRARWRSALVTDQGLRFQRTMLIGRATGFASGPPVVGPWRPVRLERHRLLGVERLELRPRLRDDGSGVLTVAVELRELAGEIEAAVVEVSHHGQAHRAPLELSSRTAATRASGEVAIADVTLWWPHTHGTPTLYDVHLGVRVDGHDVDIDCGRIGFRSLEAASSIADDGLCLRVNGVEVFARGAVWTPVDALGARPGAAGPRAALERMRDAGMNLVRIPAVGAYETRAFHDACDELGLLLWQDFMFAGLDYPQGDTAFAQAVRSEAQEVMANLAGRPSLAVLCGSSELTQQPAMLGLGLEPASEPLFADLLPDVVAAAGADAIYIPTSPCGGALPFRPDRGLVHYYGVGGYLRPVSDARSSGVRFASECLALANVPERSAIEQIAHGAGAYARGAWKRGVPYDAGSASDSEDVRDHYLRELFAVDPVALRTLDHERYLELSAALTGELMAEVLGEWRRGASPCSGALIHWLSDLRPGAGWGILDHDGTPKAAYHHVRRALAPLAIWSTDEGLSGILIHVANDGPQSVRATLRLALYRDSEVNVGQAQRDVELGAHSTQAFDAEELLGRFADISWTYRFGPPAQDVVAATLTSRDTGEQLAQSFRLPAGRPLERESATALGASATLEEQGEARLSIETRRFLYGVRVELPGCAPSDDAFSVEPGGRRIVALNGVPQPGGSITALNLRGRLPISLVRNST
jgi:beta-mannosidase